MDSPLGTASTAENANRRRRRRRKHDRAKKLPDDSERESLTTRIVQPTKALETLPKGPKKKSARTEGHLQQTELMKAQLSQLNGLAPEIDDATSSSEAVEALKKTSSNSSDPTSTQQQNIDVSRRAASKQQNPTSADRPSASGSGHLWNRIYGQPLPPSKWISPAPVPGNQSIPVFGHPIPPPAGIFSSVMPGQQWNPINSDAFPHSQPSGTVVAPRSQWQLLHNHNHGSNSRGTPYTSVDFRQESHNPRSNASSSSSLPFSAPSFGQPWYPTGSNVLVSSDSRSMPASHSFDNHRHPSSEFVPPTSTSIISSSNVPYLWDNVISQPKSSQTFPQHSSHDQLPSRHTFQLPSRPAGPRSGRRYRGVEMDIAETDRRIPDDEKVTHIGGNIPIVGGTPSRLPQVKVNPFSVHPRDPILRKGKGNKPQDDIEPPSKESGGIPEPTRQYLSCCGFAPTTADSPQPILVVIDLNGTILYRPNKTRPTHFIERTDAKNFLQYALDNFNIMIWSSAKPENVNRMCHQLFPGTLKEKLVAVWGRDRMGLSGTDYNRRVQVYKRLSLIWDNPQIQGRHPEAALDKYWDQRNTIIIDDSMEKARSEPHNLVQVPEFDGSPEDPNILGELSRYLTALKMQKNVSAFVRQNPFKISCGKQS